MLRIIHLSDLHIHKAKSKTDNKNAVALCRHLKARYAGDGKAATYVVLSGDLVDDADGRQYKNLQQQVLKPLMADFTVLSAPGNHDYALAGNIPRAKGPANFRKYVRDITFPYLDVDENEGVAFIGLDSADPGDEKWFAEGVIGQPQLEALGDLLAQRKGDFTVIYLHHHPFDRHTFVALRDWREMLEVLEGKADLVLFGHKHCNETFFDWYGIDLLAASGKVTEAAGNGLAYRVVEIDAKKIVNVRTEEIRAAK